MDGKESTIALVQLLWDFREMYDYVFEFYGTSTFHRLSTNEESLDIYYEIKNFVNITFGRVEDEKARSATEKPPT